MHTNPGYAFRAQPPPQSFVDEDDSEPYDFFSVEEVTSLDDEDDLAEAPTQCRSFDDEDTAQPSPWTDPDDVDLVDPRNIRLVLLACREGRVVRRVVRRGRT